MKLFKAIMIVGCIASMSPTEATLFKKALGACKRILNLAELSIRPKVSFKQPIQPTISAAQRTHLPNQLESKARSGGGEAVHSIDNTDHSSDGGE